MQRAPLANRQCGTTSAGASHPQRAAGLVGFRHVPLWLTDRELDELLEELRPAVQSRIDHHPGRERRRRVIVTVVMPDNRSNVHRT